jgi:hypothetical protein
MNWQLLLVGTVVLLSVLYLAQQTWKTWSRKKGACPGGCCGGKKTQKDISGHGKSYLPAEQLTLLRRNPVNGRQ